MIRDKNDQVVRIIDASFPDDLKCEVNGREEFLHINDLHADGGFQEILEALRDAPERVARDLMMI